MFNNLIESSSHRKELKRRGSFFLVTTATYGLMLVLTGVASIYAYDARLDEQTNELQLVMFVPPEEQKKPEPEIPRNTIRPTAHATGNASQSTRTKLIDSPSNPTNVPTTVGITAPDVPPARVDSKIGKFNADPELPTYSRNPGTGNGPVRVIIADPPPPPNPPTPPQPKIVRTSTVLNSKALSLPKPVYPPLAKQIGQHGTVTVQVLIDETGRVISAQAIGGPPLLIAEAKKAALQARFSPTMIGEQPVKVSGVITYNFVLQ